MDHSDLTGEIIGAAYDVYNGLGSGFLESVYEKSLTIELELKGLEAKRQQPLSVSYRGEVVGEFFADLIVNDLVIVELKAVERLSTAHEVQLVNYLVATGMPLGLLVNFGPDQVDVKRKSRDYKPSSC